VAAVPQFTRQSIAPAHCTAQTAERTQAVAQVLPAPHCTLQLSNVLEQSTVHVAFSRQSMVQSPTSVQRGSHVRPARHTHSFAVHSGPSSSPHPAPSARAKIQPTPNGPGIVRPPLPLPVLRMLASPDRPASRASMPRRAAASSPRRKPSRNSRSGVGD
jgi:hypothetical protein